MPELPASPRNSQTGLYRPRLTSPEKRGYITVARRTLIEDTLEHLRSSAKRRSKHHFLFLGPRGIGKSHLLSLVEDNIAADRKLNASYHVVRFPEEANRLLRFADFLLGVVEILGDSLPGESPWGELYEQLSTEEDDAVIVDTLVPALKRENREKKRTLLIMLENVNQLFGLKMRGSTHVAAMRKFFMDDNGCMLMATAPVYFDAITSVDEPFYDFFDTQIIEHLGEEETISLIRRNLEWDRETQGDLLENFDELRPKLRAIYQMTGGNPRLTMMLYELIAYDNVIDVRQQLEALLDRITPFYQDRLNDLPAQEQAVLETIAMMRDTEKTPDAIAARMRMKPSQVSSLLKRLNKTHYLRSAPHPVDKRRRLYNIREQFFDIWFSMNVSRGARRRIPYLLDFFKVFYPRVEEREQKRRELREEKWKTDMANSRAALDHLSELGDDGEKAGAKLRLAADLNRHQLKEDAAGYIAEARQLKLDPMGRWIVRHSAADTDYLGEMEQMIKCWQEHRSGNLEAFSRKLLEYGKTLTYRSFSRARLEFLLAQLEHMPEGDGKTKLRLRIASCLSDMAQWHDAERQLRTAHKECLPDSRMHTAVLNNLALLLRATNRLDEAEPLMRRALAIDESSFGEEHPEVATDLNNLALLLQATNRLDEAEPLMRRALAIDESSFGEEHPKVAIHLNNLASLLQATNRLDEAERLMRRALAIDESSFGEEHPKVAIRLNNLASLLQATNRLDEAEPLMRRALAIDESSFGEEHPDVARDLNNLASLLQATNRLDEAEPLMRRALAIDESSFGEEHPDVARDLNNLAQLLKATNRLDEAEPLMRRAMLILMQSKARTGYPHPHFDTASGNFRLLLEAKGVSPQETEERINKIRREADAYSGHGHKT